MNAEIRFFSKVYKWLQYNIYMHSCERVHQDLANILFRVKFPIVLTSDISIVSWKESHPQIVHVRG